MCKNILYRYTYIIYKKKKKMYYRGIVIALEIQSSILSLVKQITKNIQRENIKFKKNCFE